MTLKDSNENNIYEVKILPLQKAKIMVQVSKEDRVLYDLIQDNYSHSISRLAERIGMHGPNVYNAINGVKLVSLNTIDKIVAVIGYQADLGPDNTIIISPRTEPTQQPVPTPKSIFDDLPEDTKVETILGGSPEETILGRNMEEL